MNGKANDRVSVHGWDGSPPVVCDRVNCLGKAVLFADLAALDSTGHRHEYAAESYLCAKHLVMLLEQARMLLVVNLVVEPASRLERNLLATVQEHLP